jgi:hypothetical protein
MYPIHPGSKLNKTTIAMINKMIKMMFPVFPLLGVTAVFT